jgi:hypothetical protein
MNKYSELSKEQMLKVCEIINPDTEWSFLQILDNDGKGTDDSYEFTATNGSIAQFNIHRSEDDELRFYLEGDIDNGDISDLLKIPENNIEFKKITEFLNSLKKTSKSSNTKSFTNEKTVISDNDIKLKFVENRGIDKFTKVEDYGLGRLVDLDKTILDNLADAQAGVSDLNSSLENIGAKLKKSNFFLTLNLTYRKKSDEDIFILKIKLLQINLGGHDFKVNALKDGKITFLFDANETMTVNKVISYQEGTSEELYLETDISLLSNIINSKNIEYRLEGTRGVISESKLSTIDVFNFIGFYNALFDQTFKKDEIVSFMNKEIIENERKKKQEEKKKIEVHNKKMEAAIKNKTTTPSNKSSSSCFIVTATMNDPNHQVVNDFRTYRDRYLLNNKAGFNFIKFYYLVGPYFARLINNSEVLRKISFKSFIKPLHKLIQRKLDTNNH